ncbi:PTS lactose transporter subunit IIB [Brachybacterium rhamnosum]|uniref:PTS sugar transporter subunit IIB n=1 Tax=Brachybacterium rhamnosum TaxID=173361 RepID=A0ABW4PU15_9MICO|nr:PTS lactose transporter subunit IIB [Brachybacterium sp. SGAir0954]QCR54627.1 PTS lactose transporter subunit IIB [Brachybacterium sp. SGAir0954]
MLTIAVVCGAGVATSALIAQQVRDHLAHRAGDAEVVQSTVIDLLSPRFTADVVVSTVDLPSTLGIPRVNGMPLLLGTNPALTFTDLDALLDRLESTPR